MAASTLHFGSPPPYTSSAVQAQLEETVERLQEVVNDVLPISEDAPREARRLRTFLAWVLATDYGRHTKVCLPAADREHFLQLAKSLLDLRTVYNQTTLTEHERAILTPYFWRFLHVPCEVLGIPMHLAALRIIDFGKFQDNAGLYRSAAYGVLHVRGLCYLAYKLLLDRTFLVDRVFDSVSERNHVLTGLNNVQSQFFQSIEGIDSSTMQWGPGEHWAYVRNIVYTLSDQGAAYERDRSAALASAQSGAKLSLQHWAQRVGTCLRLAMKRKDGHPRLGEAPSSKLVKAEPQKKGSDGKNSDGKDEWMQHEPLRFPPFRRFVVGSSGTV